MERDAITAALVAYEVGEELGRGSWGVVYAGRHRRLERDVAIKLLAPAVAADEGVRARFLAEGRVLASLDHPHVVPVYDAVEHDGHCMLVMERLRAAASPIACRWHRRRPSRSRSPLPPGCSTRTTAACCTATSSQTTCSSAATGC